jgi:uncharacterized protein (TIGR02453 family)
VSGINSIIREAHLKSAFPGFPQEGIDFLRRLARNNRREWFQPRKAIFEEQVKRPMFELVEAVNAALARFAPEHVTEPERAVYRFYRDTRFSADKSPYKDHIAATFARRGLARHEGASYYFAVSHKEVGLGGGVYMPTPETLMAMRRRIAERHEEFRRIISASALRNLYGEMQGEQLSRLPKGFACGHRAEDLLRFKQFLFYTELPAEIAATPALYEEIVKRFRAMARFNEFLNEAIVGGKRGPDPLTVG